MDSLGAGIFSLWSAISPQGATSCGSRAKQSPAERNHLGPGHLGKALSLPTCFLLSGLGISFAAPHTLQRGRRLPTRALSMLMASTAVGGVAALCHSSPTDILHHAASGLFRGGPPFGSLSLAVAGTGEGPESASEGFVKEPKTGLEFPIVLDEGGVSKDLSGIGIRNKKLFGLKNLRIYAFGVYVDPSSLVEKLSSKYSGLTNEQASCSKWILDDAVAADVALTVRLVIYYKGLKIGQVRNAFEESLGGRLETISGSPNKELLNSFTKLFRDDFELHRGTTIDISRLPGQVLKTKINGQDAGSVKSALLSRAFLDLYLGEGAFDSSARQAVLENVASIVTK